MRRPAPRVLPAAPAAALATLLSACGPASSTDTDHQAGADASGGASDGRDRPGGCGVLNATVRDFRVEHPDMEENFQGNEVLPGIVAPELGDDGLPVYAAAGPTAQTSGPEAFAQWYRDVDGVNLRLEVPLVFAQTSPGVHVYEDPEFFPIDGQGFPDTAILGHNYHFTTEVRGKFTYAGGEVFTFNGDDDVWVFVNGRLAIDLGGTHEPRMGTIDFDAQADALGISLGQEYPLAVFHAERHTVLSSFRIETSIDCFEVE